MSTTSTKQYTVTVVDTAELLQAITVRSANGLEGVAKGQPHATTAMSPLTLAINNNKVRSFLEEVAYPNSGTVCRLTAVDVEAADRVEYEVTLTLTKHGWEGTATVLHIGVDD